MMKGEAGDAWDVIPLVSKEPPKMSEQNKQALQWAQKNATDPRAKAMVKKLQSKGLI